MYKQTIKQTNETEKTGCLKCLWLVCTVVWIIDERVVLLTAFWIQSMICKSLL